MLFRCPWSCGCHRRTVRLHTAGVCVRFLFSTVQSVRMYLMQNYSLFTLPLSKTSLRFFSYLPDGIVLLPVARRSTPLVAIKTLVIPTRNGWNCPFKTVVLTGRNEWNCAFKTVVLTCQNLQFPAGRGLRIAISACKTTM